MRPHHSNTVTKIIADNYRLPNQSLIKSNYYLSSFFLCFTVSGILFGKGTIYTIGLSVLKSTQHEGLLVTVQNEASHDVLFESFMLTTEFYGIFSHQINVTT